MGTEYDRIQATVRTPLVKLLSQKGVEGYSEKFYNPGKSKSGATIGNGVDLGQFSKRDLRRAGVPKYMIEKITKLGVLGLRGEASVKQIEEIQAPEYEKLSKGEVALLSNLVTQSIAESIARKIGADEWNSKPPGGRAVAISLKEIYGNAWYDHKSFKQFQKNDWNGLKENMQNYGDTTPDLADGINSRHRIMSDYVPNQIPLETREEEMARLAKEQVKRYNAGEPFQKADPSLYTGDQSSYNKPTKKDAADITDIFYKSGR